MKGLNFQGEAIDYQLENDLFVEQGNKIWGDLFLSIKMIFNIKIKKPGNKERYNRWVQQWKWIQIKLIIFIDKTNDNVVKIITMNIINVYYRNIYMIYH